MLKLLVLSRLYLNAVLPAIGQLASIRKCSHLKAATGLLSVLKPHKANAWNNETDKTEFVQMTLYVATRAIVVLCENAPQSMKALAKGPKGLISFELEGHDPRWVDLTPGQLKAGSGLPPRTADAEIRFADTITAVNALQDTLDALAAINAGRMSVIGHLPLADHANQLMEHVKDWLK